MVYLVRHQKLGEYRAVKRISKSADFAWKIREAEILNHLKHPQIPAIYDMEEDEEFYYIIEEYVEGESLEAYMLQSSFITPDFISHIVTEIAGILDYMHHLKPNPMIYQDLKTEHILIGKNGVKLIDFGIASYLNETGNKFQNYGTPDFCAPEKANEAKISIQTDIFGLGKILEKLIDADQKNTSRHLMHVAEKAASADLSERYHSVEAFLEDFLQSVQSEKNSYCQKHLLKKIVAAGSQTRTGTTHLSISFTKYLNCQNIFTVYQEKNPTNHLRMAIQEGGFTKEGGLYRRGNFFGMPVYGEGVSVNVPENAVVVLDYGADIKGALSEKADLFLFLMGSREWEIRQSELSYEKVKDARGLVIFSNYGNRRLAKKFAKRYAQAVYCFPLDENPFFMTKEKEKLFKGLLEHERKRNKNDWNCRERSRKRGNPLIRGAGKLCSGRKK